MVDLNGWLKTPPGFTPVTPARVFDTRVGNPPYLRNVAKVKVGPGSPLEVKLTDLPGLVPASGVGVVSIDVTSTQSVPLGDGFVTVSPCTTADAVSSVNFQAGDDAANLVLARVSATGTVCFNASAPTDLVVDVNGWFATPSGLTSVNPARVADTRPGTRRCVTFPGRPSSGGHAPGEADRSAWRHRSGDRCRGGVDQRDVHPVDR